MITFCICPGQRGRAVATSFKDIGAGLADCWLDRGLCCCTSALLGKAHSRPVAEELRGPSRLARGLLEHVAGQAEVDHGWAGLPVAVCLLAAVEAEERRRGARGCIVAVDMEQRRKTAFGT